MAATGTCFIKLGKLEHYHFSQNRFQYLRSWLSIKVVAEEFSEKAVIVLF